MWPEMTVWWVPACAGYDGCVVGDDGWVAGSRWWSGMTGRSGSGMTDVVSSGFWWRMPGNFGALKQPRWCSGVASVDSVSVVVTVPKLKPRGGLFGRRFFLCLLRTV